ncbi:hypothetical protein EDC04DRAFT_2890764 [Pisolithus marmoratus]|nr:hypothetical protein EDC04DRAFT_2890764 [Pisolithus marmoratus]
MLKSDMHKKIQQELNIDMGQIEQQMQQGDEVDIEFHMNDILVVNTEGSISGSDPCDGTGDHDGDDTDWALDCEEPTDGVDDLDDNDSGFGLDGNLLCNMACKSTTSNEEYEKKGYGSDIPG